MSKTSSIQSAPPAPAVPPPGVVESPPHRRPQRFPLLMKLLKPLASLRLTVVLFLLSMVLVFCGTLAQVDDGIWVVLHRYFRCCLAWIPWQVFVRFGQVFFPFVFPKTMTVPGSFPFPGGYVIGGALLVNLLAAHAVRFKVSWKRSGILLIHSGLIVMMLGELVTGLFAVEGNMSITIGSASNFVEHADHTELAFVKHLDEKQDDVTAVAEGTVRKGGLIQDAALPCDVQVLQYMVNSAVVDLDKAPAGTPNPADKGFGSEAVAVEKAPGTGVETEQKRDVASAYVTLKKKGTGENLGTYLVSVYWKPQKVTIDGQTYELSLRFRRSYRDYTMYLKEFKHDTYVGTNTAKNYSSLVQVVDPTSGEDHEVLIWMNHPLFYRGETFYQSQVQQDAAGNETGTVLQVVRNPGWIMPYVSCLMVSLGMALHFGLNLVNFLNRRAAA
ncbi:MAG TPA: cytochrome c biogenesis protein ResB [Gemmataceae bacterium]|jgi:hypothetical protein|nr:cytochrome c biogenesis protein ResB [Gemmataceae bacterium]